MSIRGEAEARMRRREAAKTTATIVQIWKAGVLAYEYSASAVVLLARETMTDLLVTEDGIDVTATMPRLHRIEATRELIAEAHELRAAELRGESHTGRVAEPYLPRALLHNREDKS